VAQQADPHHRRSIISQGALSLFNLVIGSYTEEVPLLEAAANMMLYVAVPFLRIFLSA
jgi:hypothetical protein